MRWGGGAEDGWRYDVVQVTRGTGLELGRAALKGFPHWLGVREKGNHELPPGEAANYWVDSFDSMPDFKASCCDFIVVRDLELTDGLRREASRILRVGGVLCEVQSGVVTAWRNDGFKLVRSEVLDPPAGKTACVVRYGGIGDALQAASVLPELKRQGYRVSLMCDELVHEVLKHDPNIDEFLVQDRNQVPPIELQRFWKHWQQKYTRWINLCGITEGCLIKLPESADFYFPDEVRREQCDHNYVEYLARVAELPFHPEYRFYPTLEERADAEALVAEVTSRVNEGAKIGERGKRPLIAMWALSGSAIHKTYPHQDAVMNALLETFPHLHIVTVGDKDCKVLEQGWEKHGRVHNMAGELTVRQSLTLAQLCDLVVGPETGVLNGVAFESNAKVLLLSHSSHKNLSRDWVNTDALASGDTPCYPCHRIHKTTEYCAIHTDTATAMCQWNLRPDLVTAACARALDARDLVKNRLMVAA